MGLFRKKTRQEKVEKRIEDVFEQLTSTVECEFTELETVQIINDVRRKLNIHLNARKSYHQSVITASQQSINEIQEAIQYLE